MKFSITVRFVVSEVAVMHNYIQTELKETLTLQNKLTIKNNLMRLAIPYIFIYVSTKFGRFLI